MSQPLLPYAVPAKLQSPLLHESPDTIPPTDELEAVQNELKLLKQKSLERARKADGDLKAIEIAIKKLREREKGKSKVKREQSCTPSLGDRGTYSPSMAHATINRGTPLASSNSASVVANAAVEAKKAKKKDKDKKRKRDAGDSDGEHDVQRPRKFSPHPPSVKEAHQYKPSKLGASSHSKASAAPDWSLPQASSSSLLLPSRPPVQPPPPAGPRRPIEVTEDFTRVKSTPQQTPVSTFYTSIEPWLRGVREEDLGLMDFTGDELDPYIMPKLGRHYTELWEEEDIASYGGVPTQLDFSRSHPGPSSASSSSVHPKWDSSTITDSDLATEKGLGPMTERLVSAMLPVDDKLRKSVSQAEDAYETRNSASGVAVNGVLPKEKVVVSDYEERVKDTVRFLGLLEGDPDYSQNSDDPVAATLRSAQRQLKQVVAINKARKVRLTEIARDRIAYQEYVDARDAIDKNISATYTKLQKKDGPKINKKKKKGEVNNSVNGIGINGAVVPLPNPASLGLGPDDDNHLVVPDGLHTLVEMRRQWVDVIGGGFEVMERENPGRIRGLPQKSVFEGIEEEVQQELGVGHYFLHWGGSRGERVDGHSAPASVSGGT